MSTQSAFGEVPSFISTVSSLSSSLTANAQEQYAKRLVGLNGEWSTEWEILEYNPELQYWLALSDYNSLKMSIEDLINYGGRKIHRDELQRVLGRI